MSACNCCEDPAPQINIGIRFAEASNVMSSSNMGTCTFYDTETDKHYRTREAIEYLTRTEGSPPEPHYYKKTTTSTLSLNTSTFLCESPAPTVVEIEVGALGTGEINYYDEVTLDDLDAEARTHADALLEDATFGDWGDTVQNSDRPVASAQATNMVSLQKSETRLEHSPSPSCYLKVWVRDRTYNIKTEETTMGGTRIYEWNGTGDPCLAEPTVSAYDEANKVIETGTQDFTPPSGFGQVLLEAKYSLHPDYEPAWDDLHYMVLTPGWRP